MIEYIYIKNFRSLRDFKLNFEDDITVIVGENDCGKTSILESLKIVFGKQKFEESDFSNGSDESFIEVKIKNKSYIKNLKKLDNFIDENSFIKLDKGDIDDIKDKLSSSSFVALDDEDKRQKLFEFAKELEINTGRISRIDTLTDKIEKKIRELEQNSYIVPISQIPNDYNLFFLDGKHFQNLDDHIDELYFNQIRQDIWKKEINGETVEEIINTHLHDSVIDLETQIKDQGSIEKLRAYLPKITHIKIIPELTPRLTIGVKVQLLEGTEIIPVEKKREWN